jgi:hypothetical protein
MRVFRTVNGINETATVVRLVAASASAPNGLQTGDGQYDDKDTSAVCLDRKCSLGVG